MGLIILLYAGGGVCFMSKSRNTLIAAMVLVGISSLGSLVSAAAASPRLELTPRDKDTVRLLLQMEPDQNGKVTKAQFMGFMEAEFDRLDLNRDGTIDLKEFGQAHYYVHAGGPHR